MTVNLNYLAVVLVLPVLLGGVPVQAEGDSFYTDLPYVGPTGACDPSAHYLDFSATPEPEKRPAPGLGQHTHEVLGCDPQEIESLLAAQIVVDGNAEDA